MSLSSDFVTSASGAGRMLAEPAHRHGQLRLGPPAGSSDPIAALALHNAAVLVPPGPLGGCGTTDHHLPALVGFAPIVASTTL